MVESKKWRESHREIARALTKAWEEKNKDRRAKNERRRRAKNLGMCPRCVALYKATPLWLTEEQRLEIENFYNLCPKDMEIDHIIPIRGTIVCGLNVPWNLQYLDKSANSRKGNRI